MRKKHKKRMPNTNNWLTTNTHFLGHTQPVANTIPYLGYPEGSKTWHFMDKRIHAFLCALTFLCREAIIERVPSNDCILRFSFQVRANNYQPYPGAATTVSSDDNNILRAMENVVREPGTTRAPEISLNTMFFFKRGNLVRDVRGSIHIHHSPGWIQWGFQGRDSCSLLEYTHSYNEYQYPTITETDAARIMEKQDEAFDKVLKIAGITTGRLP